MLILNYKIDQHIYNIMFVNIMLIKLTKKKLKTIQIHWHILCQQ